MEQFETEFELEGIWSKVQSSLEKWQFQVFSNHLFKKMQLIVKTTFS